MVPGYFLKVMQEIGRHHGAKLWLILLRLVWLFLRMRWPPAEAE